MSANNSADPSQPTTSATLKQQIISEVSSNSNTPMPELSSMLDCLVTAAILEYVTKQVEQLKTK